MKVRVDLGKCVGHGRCYALAPEVFGEDERGHCRVLREVIPAAFEHQARLGEANCPEDAIRVEES
jgi:ferredoxin